MNNQKILVPVDFSEASPAAIHLANTLAMKSNTSVTLIHIKTNKSHEDALQRMSDLVGEAKSASSVQFNFLLKEGGCFKRNCRHGQ